MGRLGTIVVCALLIAVAVPVGAAAAPASRGRVLATGDSMIQYVDFALRARLRPQQLKVRSDAHVGTGISKPFQLDWVRHARSIAASYRPKASVVFIGANDGFPMRWHGHQVQCCSSNWVRAYAGRVRAMMRALERGGSARVYWLTLPDARPHGFEKIFRRVNKALRLAAAAEHGRGVRLLDMGRIFTPKGRFRRSMKHNGRRIVVRQDDGIHLNRAGAGIAAGAVVRAMRRDGVLG
jgi:hypothetical protein